MPKTVQGQNNTWHILDLIGSGDAGEVLRVQSLDQQTKAVMKRPLQNASGGTILRQAMQIETEGQVLADLDGVDVQRRGLLIHTPILLDKSPIESSRTAKLFIISEEVSGSAVSSLLKAFHQDGKPISQVLVVRVLNGLLQLLRKTHEKGILWNDVKMEHIFWDPAAKKLSFIDWGNSLRFDPHSASQEKVSPFLDYQQMLAEGRMFIEQTAPQLLQELAWPLSAAELDEEALTSLRFRTEYLESYLSMRVVEYQVLLRKYQARIQDSETLAELLELSKALEQLGVPADPQTILASAADLVDSLLVFCDYAQVKQVCDLILQHLPQSAGNNWQLGSYILTLEALKDQPLHIPLLKAVFSSNWVEAVWILQTIQESPQMHYNLQPLLMALRDASLENPAASATVHSLILKVSDEIEQWNTALRPDATADQAALKHLQNSLTAIKTSWPSLHEHEILGEKALTLRHWINQNAHLALPSLPALKTALTRLLTRFRELHRSWHEADWDGLETKTKECFLSEPALIYLPQIARWAQDMRAWVEVFKEGPQRNETVTQFAVNLVNAFPKGTNHFGITDWLQGYWEAAHHIIKAKDIEVLRQEAQKGTWPFPWLQLSTITLDLPFDLAQQTSLTPEQSNLTAQFYKALQTSSDPIAQLERLRQSLPVFYPLYRDLAAAFTNAFNPIEVPLPNLDPEAFPLTERAAIRESLQVLELVSAWKSAQDAGQLLETTQSEDAPANWLILTKLEKASKTWQRRILPVLTAIQQKSWEQLSDPKPDTPQDALNHCALALSRLAYAWGKISDLGLFKEQVNEMISDADTAQTAFLQFWQTNEQGDDVVLSRLLRANQTFLSSINNYLLSICRQLRTVLRALDVVNTPEMARTRLAQNSASDLIFALVQLDKLLKPPSRKQSPILQWQKQYLDLLNQTDRNSIQHAIQAIESIHPLLPWFDELLRRDAGYFEDPGRRQW